MNIPAKHATRAAHADDDRSAGVDTVYDVASLQFSSCVLTDSEDIFIIVTMKAHESFCGRTNGIRTRCCYT